MTNSPTLRFDALCRTARALFAVPVASVCIKGVRGQWVDFAEGVDRSDWPFITAPDGWPDGAAAPGVRFVASVPFGPDGVGRLAVFDTREHAWSAEAKQRLDDLGAIADHCLSLFQTAREASEQGARFRQLADTTTDTIVRGDLEGTRLYISPSVRDLLGYEPEELIGRKAVDVTHPADLPAFRALMQKVRDGQLEVGVIEVRQRHKTGAWIWMEASVRLTVDPLTGAPDGYVSTVRATSHRKELEQKLEYLASYDDLTGLPNRTLFGQRLREMMEQAGRTGRGFVLLYMDLDRFKLVNDGFGHPAGDVVLRETAQRFRTILREDDLVARLGGDEFAAILEADRSEAAHLSERLIAAIGRPIRLDPDDTEISIGLSIGIACAPKNGSTHEEVLSCADQALYRAKAKGRNRFCFFDE
jgi:diguanylate cyclase (GGDEF)-like protein/PAS domain S-box-containing protein